MHNRTTANIMPMHRRNLRRASLILLPALLLAGCGSSPSPNADLEARIAAAEAKAEQAENRSKEALSMAMSGSSSSSGGPSTPEEFSEEVMNDQDAFANDQGYPDQMAPQTPSGQGMQQGQILPDS